MKRDNPNLADLVFLGGGHAQVAAIKHFAMNPVPGLRLTIVTTRLRTPYSGMLPGYVEGVWQDDDIHLDLAHLAQIANARLIVATCTGIDAAARRLLFDRRPPLHFDVLSVNIGGQPDLGAIAGARDYAIPVKPIGQFQRGFMQYDQSGDLGEVAVIGGGAAGCELALALNRHWHNAGRQAQITIYGRSPEVLPGMAKRAGSLMRHALAEAGIVLRLGVAVARLDATHLYLADHGKARYDAAFLVSAVRPPAWLGHSGLALDDAGFIKIGPTLQSTSHPYVFAAGDIAGLSAAPRPKAGVFAVRAGPILAKNLRRYLFGERLLPWRIQKHYLAILGLGDGTAIACRGPLAIRSKWALTLKHWIDRRFMRQYTAISMPVPPPPAPFAGLSGADEKSDESKTDPAFAAMRCLGCAAKASRVVLDQALADAADAARAFGIDANLLPQAGLADDVGVLPSPPDEHHLLQSVDALSEIVTDPFLLGKIAAIHALSDLYAAGATPVSALAVINLPPARLTLQQNQLTQILAGALIALGSDGVRLSGGHTSEGGALSVGFAVSGHAPSRLNRPSLPERALLVLSKPLGTGVVMAGSMKHLSRPDWIAAAVENMLLSNAGAAKIFASHECIEATDVTGFGLARHAQNLALRVGAGGCEIMLGQVPVLAGALWLCEQGVVSSLAAQNEAATDIVPPRSAGLSGSAEARRALLFDPQTSGGLLGVFDESHAEKVVAALVDKGHMAAIVGRMTKDETGVKIIYDDAIKDRVET